MKLMPLLLLALGAPVAGAVTVGHLRCEYRENPLGIDVAKPRLSWEINSDTRGERQTAYQIRVERGDQVVWDSGKVASGQSVNVEYSGSPLVSRAEYQWRVRLWDKDGTASDWSRPASWSMGLIAPGDWKAHWIGYDAAYEKPVNPLFTTKGLRWVRMPHGKTNRLFLRRQFELPSDRTVRHAFVVVYPDNECEVTVNQRPCGQAVRWEATTRLEVTDALRSGTNVIGLAVTHTDFLPPSVLGKLVVQFTSGDDLQLPIDGTWKAAEEAAANWDARSFNDHEWVAAQPFNGTPWGSPALNDLPRVPASYLRKTFTLDQHVKRATVYVTALGAYELHLNGQRVGRDVLTPGWTDFHKRVYYQTYDVTGLVREGNNVLGAILGDGWYASALAFTGKRNFYGGMPRLLAQLVIKCADGSVQPIVTDGSWKAAYGPIRHADLLIGCDYDARLAMPGWDRAGFNDSGWSPVVENNGRMSASPDVAAPLVQATVADASRRFEELPARKITEPVPGVYIFDLGQNMVGWARLRVSGQRGQRLVVRYGEMLNPDGTLYTANLRGATATDFFELAGGGPEVLEPYFTFHGFRYVEVRGLAAKPGLDMVTGIVVHSEMERTGNFECSNPLVNQLYHNIIWGQKGNYLEVPTDCPQRDERAGWTGDTQFFVPTAAYNFDVDPFFTRWLTTICEDSQHADGSFAHVAPDLGLGSGSVAWGDAGLICTYNMYRTYGDTRVIADHFPALERFMKWYASKSTNLIPNIGGFGDWLNVGGSATREVIDTAYYAYDAGLMAEMARAIGNEEAAARYAKLHSDIKAVFAKFFDEDGTLRHCSQTGYALAFTMGLVPENLREKAAAGYAAEIKRFNWHLATGFIGTPRLLPGLHLAGRDDLAYRLLLQETYPSWLFQVKLGATTMWERWDGWTPERGFEDRGMNSFNHYAFGSVGQYLYSVVGGIQPASPGYKTIRIEPEPEAGLTWAKTDFDSDYGRIATDWKRDGKQLTLAVVIPPNTTATVYVPTRDATSVTESGKPATEAEGVKFLRFEGGAAVYAVESGHYQFAATP